MSYALVHITNSTSFVASGKVEYVSAFCSDDEYQVSPFSSWKADSRGVCLVSKITATVNTPDGNFDANPYTSSGTSYSEFTIIQVAPDTFQVIRPVPRDEEPPKDHMPPTSRQK